MDQFGLERTEVAVIHGGRIRVNNEDAAISRFLLMHVDGGFPPAHATLDAQTEIGNPARPCISIDEHLFAIPRVIHFVCGFLRPFSSDG